MKLQGKQCSFENPRIAREYIAHTLKSLRIVMLFHNNRWNICKIDKIGFENVRYDHPIGKTMGINGGVYHVVKDEGGKLESFLKEKK